MKTGRITFKKAILKLSTLNCLLDMFTKTIACRKSSDVLKNTELLLKRQKLIHCEFVDNIFGHDNIHQDGREETFSEKYKDETMDTYNFDDEA